MANSTHQVEVVPIVMEKHPNADTLSIVNVFGGYTCVVRTQDWQDVKFGAYLPPDSLVDTTRPEFLFLAEHAKDNKHRVKAKKLRGIVSFGLMVPAPTGSNLGDDVAELLGVEHYEPPSPGEQRASNSLVVGGEIAKGPDLFSPKYDVDAFRKYHSLFEEGEQVWVTEKIHGCNARYTFKDGVMYCGSRTEWKREYPDYSHVTMEWLHERVVKKDYQHCDECSPIDEPDEERCQLIYDKLHNRPKPRNLWWRALDMEPGVEKWCRDHPGLILYGECFGNVTSLKYGHGPDKTLSIAVFDILDGATWIAPQVARDMAVNVPWVPLLGIFNYNFDIVVTLSDGPSKWPGADHYREGCVVKPIVERTDPSVGRVCLKCVGGTYLEKDK